MWLNCSRTRVKPGQTADVVHILSGKTSMDPLHSARGFYGLYLVESTEVPGELISITFWESADDGQSYLASPECREVIESIQKYLLTPIERSYYDVHLVG